MKRWNRVETWLTVIIVAAGLVPTALLALWSYMSATATTLHPSPREVPSSTRSAPIGRWADAVEQGRQLARATLTEQNLPGLSVAVGVGGDIVWTEGFGWADFEKRVPVTPETKFRIGTASTVLTSAAVGLLLEDGRLQLDEVIQTYVPAFPPQPWPVTLRQLMSHTAGVRNDGGDEGALYAQRCERAADALQFFAASPLRFEPGTRYRYSSYGWIVVSAAVEAAADEPLHAFMQKTIFDPLGMRDTETDSLTEAIPNRATFYFPRFAADPRYGLHLMRPVDYSCYSGASVFLSTPSDLVRFGMAIARGAVLRRETVQLLQTSQRLASGEETGYGLGWDLETVEVAGEQTRWVGHSGTTLGGTVASLVTFPAQEIVVAVTSNLSYAGTEALAVTIAQVFGARRAPSTANRTSP